MNKIFFNRKNNIIQICLLFLCLIIGGSLSVYYGLDANWDLQNYHLYNAFQFLHDGIKKDFMAAGIQTYLNPILDLPYYYLSVEWFQNSPKVVAFFMGLPYGVVIFLCLSIANEISLSLPKPKKLEVFLAAVFGLTGTIVLSEVGTTFNDMQISVIVLLSLLFELKAVDRENYKGIMSGVLLGIAAGLKITSVIFAPAMLVAILITSKSFHSPLRAGFLFCFFWGIGFSITGGFWAYELFKNFGNPIFPFFNSLFHSPWYSLGGGERDMRFIPKDLIEAIFYPFFWLSGKPTIAENPMRDGRYAVAFISVVIYGFLYFIHNLEPSILSNDLKSILKNQKVLLVVSFFTVSYIVWEMMFSIGRYAIPLEILTGLLFLIGYKLCYEQFGSKLIVRVIVRATAALILVLIPFISLPINWGRQQYSQSSLHPTFAFFLPNFDIRVPKNSTVFIFGKPIAYIIPFIDSPGSVYFGLSEGVDDLPASSPPIEMIYSRLKENGPIFILTNVNDAQQSLSKIAHKGLLPKIADLIIESSQCKIINDNYQIVIKLCPVQLLQE